ncbi:MAG TPA: O-antigen ligase family protein, partial [Candidatus Limnocylindrales bacterium]|nr:O-antigen ligase family protein [Candidatus Limnocylindrales bacterium]
MISPRRAGELAAAVIGLAVLAYVGWDGAMWDPRYQLALHLAGVAGAVGLLWIGLAGGLLPRTRLELPVLGLLLAFGVASLSAWNPGLSAQALASIVGTTLMLPIAMLAIRHRPGWTALVVTGPILVLAAGALAALGSRRLDWLAAGGPGLPPVRLGHETTVFGSVAVPPFVLMAAMPIALLIPQRWLRLGVLAGLAVVAVPLTAISGSRSAWISLAVSGMVLLAPAAFGRLRRAQASGGILPSRRWSPRRAGIAFVSLAGAVMALAFVAPRLTDLRSLVYRGFLWRDTISAWSADPVFGIGPGSMPFARQAAAPALTFPVRQPHSHDIPLGILGDAGLIGLVAAVVVFIAFVVLAGPWRTRRLPGRAAFAVLMGFAVGMLSEDLTFLPNFNLLVMLLVAMALIDGDAVHWRRLDLRRAAPRWTAALAGVGAAALLGLMLLGDASAIAYRTGTDAAGDGRWPVAFTALQRAVELNPWQPTGPKSLAVAADRVGRPRTARAAAARAAELSPGDGPTWTNLALLCAADGDRACARHAADGAVETASAAGRELANAALVYDWLGDQGAADRTYRLSLLTNYWTGLTMTWPRAVIVGEGRASELGIDAAELNLLIARRLAGEPIRVADYTGAVTRALAYAMLGDPDAADAEIDRAKGLASGSTTTWEVAALLERHYGGDPQPMIRISNVVRGVPLSGGASRPAYLIFDIATFRAYPADGLVSAA